jgi:uncharacterized 2Fe-2S/4Fe-4S cluster protein (DUF4445 family)
MKEESRRCSLTVVVGGKIRSVEAPEGEILLRAVRRAGIAVEAPCGGLGWCGKCRVRVDGPLAPPDEKEQQILGDAIKAGWRLACRARLAGDAVVEIPDGAIDSDGKTRPVVVDGERKVEPRPETIPVPLTFGWDEIGSGDTVESFLRRKVAGVTGVYPEPLGLSATADLAEVLQPGGRTSLVCALRENRVVGVVGGVDRAPFLGAACDIGTTTLVCYLVDLESGEDLGVMASRNPQFPFGNDVISRITHALDDPAARETMTASVRAEIGRMLQELARRAGRDLSSCVELLLVGNTCMHHLFLGLSPVTLGRSPFCPVTTGTEPLEAGGLGLPLPRWARVRFLPLLGGFVGADMTGVLCRVASLPEKKTRIVVDLGTNGEIALVRNERILVCSTAAGPAFEGGNISAGMLALPGAVNGASWEDDDLALSVIGGGPAKGLCGPGLIDVVALLLEKGVIDRSGRIVDGSSLPWPSLAARIVNQGRSRAVRLDDDGLMLTQKDVRELQLAKGAMEAAVNLLLEREGLGWDDVDECILAGAFGNYIRPRSVVALGLFPPCLEERIVAIGNGAGEGARSVLIGGAASWQAAIDLASRVQHVLLEKEPAFQERFVHAMAFGGSSQISPNPSVRSVGVSLLRQRTIKE